LEDFVRAIQLRAKSPKAPTGSGRCSKRHGMRFQDLVFLAARLTERPVDYFREEVDTETVLGKMAKQPLKLRIPIAVAAMSFGALSREAKIALAKAAAVVGTATNTGEGGMLPEERREAKLLIAQYSTGRFGVDEDYLKKADAIEFKVGQGAKPGQGGLLPGEKVTEEIASVRKVPKGVDVHSPPSHPDIADVKELGERIKWLKEVTGGKPVILKLGAGHVEEDVKAGLKAKPDVIAIDGMLGGTGAAPEIMLEDFGLPVMSSLVKARKVLDDAGARQELMVAGGMNTGADMAKALALGADAVFPGFPLMVAMGCNYCRLCYKGMCALGIATQDSALRKNFDMERAVLGAANYMQSCTEEMKMAAAATGKKSIHNLSGGSLRALTKEAAEAASVPLA
jgi:glutamate synthase domain-containing protein 2